MGKRHYKHLGKGIEISVIDFNYIDRLSQKAQKKVEKIINKMPSKSYISSNISKFSIRFGGWEEGWRNFKTMKGIDIYKKHLENFLKDDWEAKQVNAYKEHLMSAMKNITLFKTVPTLKKELKDIKDVNEFDYIWEQTNGRLNIGYIYVRGENDAFKVYKEVLHLIRKYKEQYRNL